MAKKATIKKIPKNGDFAFYPTSGKNVKLTELNKVEGYTIYKLIGKENTKKSTEVTKLTVMGQVDARGLTFFVASKQIRTTNSQL